MGVASRNMQKTLKLRVSAADESALKAAAETVGLTVSAWMRMVLLERVAELRGRKALP